MYTWIVGRAVPDGVEPGDVLEEDITVVRAVSTSSSASDVAADTPTGERATRQTPAEQSNTPWIDSSHTVTITCPDGCGPFLTLHLSKHSWIRTFGMSVIYRPV